MIVKSGETLQSQVVRQRYPSTPIVKVKQFNQTWGRAGGGVLPSSHQPLIPCSTILFQSSPTPNTLEERIPTLHSPDMPLHAPLYLLLEHSFCAHPTLASFGRPHPLTHSPTPPPPPYFSININGCPLSNMTTMALPPLPVSLSFSVVILILAYKLYQHLRFKLPPGPRPWPVVGNLYQIKPVRFRCYSEWAQSYGPIISVWTGSTLNVVVSNSELARQVLKDHDQKLADRHRNRSAAKFSKDGQDLIWADYGPHYVKVRKVCTLELFSPKRIEALRPIREDEVTAMVESIYNYCTAAENYGKTLSVRNYLGAVAFNNITRLAFGKRFVNSVGVIDKQGLEFKAIVANGLKLGASLAMAEHIPWLRWMFPLDEEAFAKHGERRDRLTREIMEEHIQARNKSGGVAKQHFVDALLTLQDKYDLSEDTIVGLLWDMITAGMDTTVISVEWAMAELIKNPRVQQKAQEELDRVIGSDRVMTETDFLSLPYLQCVTKEALRMHPPTPLMLPHRANANVKIGGYDIPKGSNVHVNVWAVARDPAVWKDPNEFRPERFLEEDVDMKGHDFRLLPFGAGRRVCPGAQLGINLVASMLGHLLHHFSWAPAKEVNPQEIDMSESPGLVTYMRTPLHAVPTPRLPSDLLYKRVAVDM